MINPNLLKVGYEKLKNLSLYVSSFVCNGVTQARFRYSDCAGIAWSQGCKNDNDLYPCNFEWERCDFTDGWRRQALLNSALLLNHELDAKGET